MFRVGASAVVIDDEGHLLTLTRGNPRRLSTHEHRR